MDSFSGYLTFVNFGVLGLFVMALLTGFLYTKGYVDEMRERHEKEVNEYKQALALERQRNEIGDIAASILKDIAQELRKEITR